MEEAKAKTAQSAKQNAPATRTHMSPHHGSGRPGLLSPGQAPKVLGCQPFFPLQKCEHLPQTLAAYAGLQPFFKGFLVFPGNNTPETMPWGHAVHTWAPARIWSPVLILIHGLQSISIKTIILPAKSMTAKNAFTLNEWTIISQLNSCL